MKLENLIFGLLLTAFTLGGCGENESAAPSVREQEQQVPELTDEMADAVDTTGSSGGEETESEFRPLGYSVGKAPPLPMTASIDDSSLTFSSQLMIIIAPNDERNESWSVVLLTNLRPTEDAPELRGRGNIAFSTGVSGDESKSLFSGLEMSNSGGVFTYPADVDGLWLSREINTVEIDVVEGQQIHASFGLGPKIHITEDDIRWEETGSSVVDIHGPPAVSCELFREGSPILVSDTRFESEFCRGALETLGLTEWLEQ